MKNRCFYALSLFILSALLCCCTEEEQGGGYTRGDIMEFESTINGETWSRANSADNGQWQGGEKVAIKLDNGAIKEYTASSSGLLISGNPFLWAKDQYRVTAYWPITMPAIADQSTEAKYQACHVVQFDKNGVSQSNRNLVFERQMAQLIITLSPGTNVPEVPKEAKVEVLAPPITSYVDGKVSVSTSITNYKYLTAWNKGNNTYHILVPPHTNPSANPHRFIKISIGSKVFYYSFNESRSYAAGSTYRINVKVSVVMNITMKNWMKYRTSDNQLISSVSIPGTHNSGATGAGGITAFGRDKCQDRQVYQQLDDGIRYFDLRVKVVKNDPLIYHGTYYQNQNLAYIISSIAYFLKNNPSEFVMVQFKEEGKPENSSKSTYQAIRELMEYEAKGMYTQEGYRMPRVGDVRGKIVSFKRNDEGFGFKLNFRDNSGNDDWCGDQPSFIQDTYKDGRSGKEKNVINTLNSSHVSDVNKLFLNFVSCTGGGLIPDPAAQSSYLNPTIRNYIRDNSLKKTGVVLFDFYHDTDVAGVIVSKNPIVLW